MMYPLSQNDIDTIRLKAGFAEKVEIPRNLLEELIRNYKPSQERYAEAINELRRQNQALRQEIRFYEDESKVKAEAP